MTLNIASHSTGGTSYLMRILKQAKLSCKNHVDIIVDEGVCQEKVYATIVRQLNLLHEVTDVHFSHTVTKA